MLNRIPPVQVSDTREDDRHPTADFKKIIQFSPGMILSEKKFKLFFDHVGGFTAKNNLFPLRRERRKDAK
jgi:hypothetical protein